MWSSVGKAMAAVSKGASKIKSAGIGGMAKKFMFTNHKDPTSMGPIDRVVQKTLGIAEETEGGTIFKQYTKKGIATISALEAGITTGKALTGTSTEKTRGMVSVADGMDRFVSYDGSGFTKNINAVAGGDMEVMNDIVNHTFPSQRNDLNPMEQNLGDIVFALHNNREG